MPTKATINQDRYDKEHTIKYFLKLNTSTDKDIIDKIETVSKKVGSKQGAIKELIKKSEC